MKLPDNPKFLLLPVLFLSALIFFGCDDDSFYMPDLTTVPEPYEQQYGTALDTMEHDNGLIIYVYEKGNSQIPVSERDEVLVRYTGWVYSDQLTTNDIFDSSWIDDRTTPRQFKVQEVVPGFSQGLYGMEEGGKRTLIIPSELGYGSQGRSGGQGFASIPPNATLVFDVELVQILE